MFFFEKKNQKTFTYLHTLPASLAQTDKSFLLLFFKKEDLSYFTPCRAGAAIGTHTAARTDKGR
jgi:hypothetical protein